jgi:CarD family transcriptional regulator
MARSNVARTTRSKTKPSTPAPRAAQKSMVAPKEVRSVAPPQPTKPSSIVPPKAPASMKPATISPLRPPPVLGTPIAKPIPSGRELHFKVGDKAVHPAHGLGEIVSIEHRDLGGMKGEFYILKILDNGMKVMVPISGALQAGLRTVMSSKEADAVIETMRAREVAVDVQPWSRRFRAYTEMIKSGSPHEIAKVLRDMHRLKFDKDLSFGERRLLDQAKSLLMKELALAKKMSEQKMAEQIANIFQAS